MKKYIIDRRLNPKGKSLSNRQRFIRRTKKYLKERIHKNIVNRSITDKGKEDVSIPIDGISEPSFQTDPKTGEYDFVLPGNKDFLPGDKIKKPGESEGGGASEASDSGEGEDEFAFSLTRDEYMDIVFEDLELPNMEEKNREDVVVLESRRAGYTTSGSPSQLNIERSLIRSLGRRIALKFPKKREIDEVKKEIAKLEKKEPKPVAEIKKLKEYLELLQKKHKAIPFIDPIDLRFNNFVKEPKPTTTAVMICIMDVSASMGEKEKELSKRFFLLLYLFLERKYEHVDVVFIRHHTEAIECDEEEFFHSKETGGTIVSSGLELANQVLKDRYSPSEWNAYIAQASDGDNYVQDQPVLEDVLVDQVLPKVKFYTYIEISELFDKAMDFWGQAGFLTRSTRSNMWELYEKLSHQHANLVCKKIQNANQIIPVFRQFFFKRKETA